MEVRTHNTFFDKEAPSDKATDIDSAVSIHTDAALGLKQEKEMTVGRAFWYYRKAVCWSILICKLRASSNGRNSFLIVVQR